MSRNEVTKALEELRDTDYSSFAILDAYITHLERTNFGLRTTVANLREQQEKRLKGYTIRNRSRWE